MVSAPSGDYLMIWALGAWYPITDADACSKIPPPSQPSAIGCIGWPHPRIPPSSSHRDKVVDVLQKSYWVIYRCEMSALHRVSFYSPAHPIE